MRTRTVAMLLIGGTLAGTGAAVRLAAPRDADALRLAVASLAPEGVAGVVVVTDPECPACAAALRELSEVVRPGELGLAVRIVSGRGAGRPVLEAAGPGLVPLYLVVDAAGNPVAVLRGARPPELIRAWLEDAAPRAFGKPLDRAAPRGSP